MEQWIILCDIIVCDDDVRCFPVLPIAEATPEHAILMENCLRERLNFLKLKLI